MKSGNKLFIFTGAALAVVAIVLAITMSLGGENKTTADTKQDSGKVMVVKAAVDFEPHKVIASTDIITEEMDADQVPPGFISDPTQILGQAYKLKAVKGDILLAGFVEPPGIRNSIETGKRAISLSVDTQGMMSGLIMDGDYLDVVFKARVDLRRVLQTQEFELEEDGPYIIKEFIPAKPDAEASQQVQGAPGSEFMVTDGGQNLEPVSKIMVQNIKVLRVIAPGVQYDAQGQQVQSTGDENAPVEVGAGQLILEVTPAQAEVIAFIQDQNHSYEVVVRGKDDSTIVNTSGITFEILMTNDEWALPWPAPINAPEAADASDS